MANELVGHVKLCGGIFRKPTRLLLAQAIVENVEVREVDGRGVQQHEPRRLLLADKLWLVQWMLGALFLTLVVLDLRSALHDAISSASLPQVLRLLLTLILYALASGLSVELEALAEHVRILQHIAHLEYLLLLIDKQFSEGRYVVDLRVNYVQDALLFKLGGAAQLLDLGVAQPLKILRVQILQHDELLEVLAVVIILLLLRFLFAQRTT